ncbi:MAG: hypothetical protein F6J93_09480 [Oscillatoria sp. SIO1A7]|nr:hypothetical protein [Oscillatoria sp. SIO1A7]
MLIDSRDFSRQAYKSLAELKKKTIQGSDLGKASSLVQSLPAYISTWGLHRLCGDNIKYAGESRSKETRYKSQVYERFLSDLKAESQVRFEPNDPETLFDKDIRAYAGLNRLAIQMAREWSFWAVPVLGKAEEG